MMEKLTRYLSSLRCTLMLIISLGTMFLLGFIVPQKELLKKQEFLQMQGGHPLLFGIFEALGLTEVYKSPITLLLWGLFFLNLTLVMRQRIPLVWKRTESSPSKLENPLTTQAYQFKLTMSLLAFTSENLPGLFSRAGYHYYGSPERFYAVKNRFAPFATLLFHLSFFLILLAGVVSTYTKFVGYVDLGIGEAFHGEISRYKASPRMPRVGSPPEAGFVVENISPMVDSNVATGLQVALRDDGGKLHVADINRPYKTGVTSFLVSDLGVAPLVVIKDGRGRELDGAFFKLNVLKGKKDRFNLYGYEAEAMFFPDHMVVNGIDESRSEAFRNPALRLEVRRNGVLVARKVLKTGESMDLAGNVLVVQQMPFWVRLLVVKQYGDWIAYSGFIIATFALFWRFLFYRREVIGALERNGDETLLHLACRSEFYKTTSIEELTRIRAVVQDQDAA
jgi:ResB-like family protein